MKYKKTTDYSFLLDENYYVYDHKEDMETLHIFIKSKQNKCRCPKCGMESRKLHATYNRTLQDTPIRGKQTFLHANVYKYECLNSRCGCRVFTEELPFAKASQVRTDALNTLVLGVSMFLSNEGASKVLGFLGIQISNDTIQRLYDRIEFIDNPDVEEVGIDDVAIRKGQTYATAIYDLKDHHLIALLDGRDGEPLKNWLEHHKKIRLVARDRASAYAAAISAVLPDCVQVADRFHLLQNLLEHLKDIFKEDLPTKIFIRDGNVLDQEPEKIPQIKKPDDEFIDSLHYDNTPPRNPDGTEMAYDNKKHDLSSEQYRAHAQSRKKKQILIRQIQEYWERLDKKTIRSVAEAFGISLPTAKKYIHMTEAEINCLDAPANYKKRDSPMNAWLNVIFKMMLDGHSSETIYFYLLAQPEFQEGARQAEKKYISLERITSRAGQLSM